MKMHAVIAMIVGAGLLAGALPVSATPYVVANTGDNSGTNPAPGANTGTLRQAIVDSNAAGGSNTIGFSIPGTGPHTIALSSALPYITSSVTIDGFSQPGAVPNTNTPDQGPLNTQLMIEISGSNVTNFSIQAFYVNASVNVTLQGLAINGFTGDAIDGYGGGSGPAGGHTLQVFGCYLGTQLNGSVYPGGYGNIGVALRSGLDPAQIGGQLPSQRNLISGNRGGGIYVPPGSAAVIEGNLIGTDASGTLAIPSGIQNNWPGILLPGNFPNIRVGCTGASCTAPGSPSRNVISGNHNIGIGIWDNGQGTGGIEIKGNYIGTDWSGTKPLPNGHLADSNAGCPTFCAGIQLTGSSTVATPASIIGGFNAGEANLIAFNNGAGIISSPQYTANGAIGASFDSQRNLVHHNHGVDNANIDIGAIGPTPNDPGDADTGANNVQNWPEILSASQSGNQLTITYLVDSTITKSAYPLRVDFYVDASGGSTVSGGSGLWLAQDSYPASSAQMMHTVTLTVPAGVQAIPLAATATDAHDYTSEFSPAYVADRIFANGFE